MFEHLRRMSDLNHEDLMALIDCALTLKKDWKAGKRPAYLKDKTLGMIFQKASTRTRVSFEVGMLQLGGAPIVLNGSELQMGRGEPIQDTARVLSRYLDGLMIRTFAQQDIDDLAKFGSIPVINGLSDDEHPCQVLADLMTIYEYKKTLKGLKIAFIGDGNNMANSLIEGVLCAGSSITVASPEGYTPSPKILAKQSGNPRFTLVSNPVVAAEDADVVITDVWNSMGQEAEIAVRKQVFAGIYQVNEALMAHAKEDSIVLHCLPAHREEEISTETFEKHQQSIFDEAENRLHAQKAVLLMLLGEKKDGRFVV